MAADTQEIDALTDRLYGLFTNKAGVVPNLDEIFELFISQATLIKNVSGRTQSFTLQTFIEPRKRLLIKGPLTEFEEGEVTGKTLVTGTIAQRVSHYRKAGMWEGESFETQGIKMIQFVKSGKGWRISSLSWDDESADFKITGDLLNNLFGEY